MIKYFGNCLTIDWAGIIKSIEDQSPAHRGTSYKKGDGVDGVDEMAELWESAGYGDNASWDFFFPDVNFDRQIVSNFENWAKIPKKRQGRGISWISRINPGKCAPWHWDATTDYRTLRINTKIRLHCHIQPPTDGHFLFIDDACLYKKKLGDTYRWKNRNLWHGGINGGNIPMYTFNYWN